MVINCSVGCDAEGCTIREIFPVVCPERVIFQFDFIEIENKCRMQREFKLSGKQLIHFYGLKANIIPLILSRIDARFDKIFRNAVNGLHALHALMSGWSDFNYFMG